MKNLGIVLSGGGVRGMAHIGLLKALNEMNIHAEVISGSSAGALVGALYAAGHDTDTMIEFFKTTPIFNFSYYSSKKPGLIDSEKYQSYFKDYFPEDSFNALEKKLFVAVTDITKAKYHILSSGSLIKALIASASLPPVFSPVDYNGTLMADGGIMNNFPVEPLRSTCKTILGSFVNPVKKMNPKELTNTMKVFQRALDLKFYTDSKSKFKHCDFVIEPGSLYRYGILDTRNIDAIFQIGYNYAIANMDQIMKTLKQEKLTRIVA
jgi:NTE family protein